MDQVFYASVILLPLGISLRMSLRLLYGARGPQVGDPVYQIMSVLSWILTITPLLVVIIASTSWLSLLVLLIAVLAVLELVLARRDMQRRAAWALLTGELGNKPSSVESLRNHQSRFTGMVGRAFRRLVDSLEKGVNLVTAIGQHRRALPREAQAYAAIDAVGVNESADLNEKNVKQQTELTSWTQNVILQQLYQRITYLATVALVMAGIVAFLMFKIIPSYQAIFEDFELELPSVTLLLISTTSDPLGQGMLGLLYFGVFLSLVVGLLIFILYLCDIAVLQPIADRVFFANHCALVLRLFSVGVQRGEPIESLLKELAHGDQHYPSSLVRRRLTRMLRSVSAGVDWKDALRTASFIRTTEVPVLETAQKAGNLPWALNLLANQKVRSMVYRWSAAEQIIFPLAVLLVGCLVLFVCTALFLPLVDLIYSLV